MKGNRNPDMTEDDFLDYLANVLADGYTERVRSFTRSIQTDPEAVRGFEAAFDMLNADAMIDWTGTELQEQLMERVEARDDELESFLAGIGRSVDTYLLMTNHGQEATFELGWIDDVSGRPESIVWDRWTEAVDDPVMVFADVGFRFDIKDYRCEPKPAKTPEPRLYKYHPERFNAYRDYASSVAKLYRQKVEPSSGLLTVDQLNQIMRMLLPELNTRGMQFPRKFKDDYPGPSLVVEAEETLATAYGRFVQAGRQIMDFPPSLIDMLSKTDVDDVPLNNIKLPYAAQYLHFGPQADLELEPGWLVDGAYVELRGESGDVRFTVTTIPIERDLSAQWYLVPEPEYTQDFVENYRFMDLGTAVDMVLSDKLANLQERQAKHGGDITDDAKAGLSEKGVALPEGTKILNKGPEMAVHRGEITRRRHPIYKAALQLVVNALCYISAYPEDIETAWPEGTPDSLKQKADDGHGKAKMRAKSKLTAMGYVPVHLCGRRISQQRSELGLDRPEDKHLSTHWRRGHWRNQAFGPRKSLRKLIWVMPVIVGSRGDNDEPDSGHIYLLS